MDQVTSLADSCRRYLSGKGRLATAIPGFVARAPQSDLAVAIANAIEAKSTIVAEAGTGTGKTFAYLLPCILSGKKALISTATKTLQDQLFQKDVPTLVRALGLKLSIQNLKGRANYICQHRTELFAEEGQFQTPQVGHEIQKVREKLSQMTSGERSELPEINEDSPVWYYVTSTTDNCLGSECPSQETCFLIKARKRAMQADIVVINHHLFFADSQLKQEGFGELLPRFDVVIFDEAHQLAEIATNFNGERISTRQFNDVLEDSIAEWPVLDLANQPLKVLSHKAQNLVDDLLNSLPAKEEKLGWDVVERSPAFKLAWDQWLALIEEVNACFTDESIEENAALTRCKERLQELQKSLLSFSNLSRHPEHREGSPGNGVYGDKKDKDTIGRSLAALGMTEGASNKQKILWLERFKHSLVFHATPYDVADSFNRLLHHQSCAYVFTSATLTMADSFDCFCKPLGLTKAQTLLLPSPFDYKQQALLYLPRGLPDPKHVRYYELLVQKVMPVIEACGGRCFFLFTSHRALNLVAQMLANKIRFPLLIQGQEAKPILLARFRQLGNAVLLGTATFWEGVDVKGEALSCVIIDKIPFASPTDPVNRGRMAYLTDKGLSAFDELSLPNAVLALKQGVGRLIRDIQDKGVLMIADPRLTGREYGRAIMASLPPIPKTRSELKVLNFIEEFTQEYETVSD